MGRLPVCRKIQDRWLHFSSCYAPPMAIEAEARYPVSILAISMAGEAPGIFRREIREAFPFGMANTALFMAQPGEIEMSGEIGQGELIMGIVAADAGGILFISHYAAMLSFSLSSALAS